MITAQFNAYCPLEIGDKIRDTAGEVHTITDIACVHYVRTGNFTVPGSMPRLRLKTRRRKCAFG